MTTLPIYSTYFSCLHDEPKAYGALGRGTHYSVFRCTEWFDVCRRPTAQAEVHDFAVIWDEDHDTRVIEAVERIYLAGLLSPVQFIGERKGSLTVIVAARFWSYNEAEFNTYKERVQALIQPMDDYWPLEIGIFDRSGARHTNWHQNDPLGIINDQTHKVNVYLSNIDALWNLGTKPPVWPRASQAFVPPTAVPGVFPPPPAVPHMPSSPMPPRTS